MKSSEKRSRNGSVALALDELLRLPRGRKGVRARVESGTVLVTQAGDPEDHVLARGEELWLPAGGLAIAWALTPAVIEVGEDVPHRAALPRPCEGAA